MAATETGTTGSTQEGTSGGADLGTVPLPTGVCTLALGSDATATVVALDGTPVLRRPGDVRPDVAGIFTDLTIATATSGRLALSLTADNRFTTTPSFWKIALAAICLAGLVTLFVLVAAEMSTTLDLSNTQLGLIQGVGFAALTWLGAYPIAWFADRIRADLG